MDEVAAQRSKARSGDAAAPSGRSAPVGEGLAGEDRLLLLTAREVLEPRAAAAAERLIAGPLDWDYVVESAIRHAVAPLVHRSLVRLALPPGAVPPEAAAELADLYRRSAARNRRIYAAVGDVARGLQAAGVEALALKDLHLAAHVYRDPALRPLGDVDLLIRRRDYRRAAACLDGLGFEALPSADIPYTLRYAVAHHFRRAADELWIDLQWNVAQREWDTYGDGTFTFDVEGLWRRSVPTVYDGFELRAPGLSDMLLHLCLHLEGHRYGELVLFSDIAALCRSHEGSIDWPTLVAFAEAQGVVSCVYHVLLLSRQLLDAPVPAAVLARLEPPYFEAALHVPLFGNLTSLHLALDEIRLAARPAPRVMAAIERAVRRQSHAARAVYAELDAISRAVTVAGGGPLMAEGGAPPMVFPDERVDAFDDLRLLVPEHGTPIVSEVLDALGYTASGPRRTRRLWAPSTDPALSAADAAVDVHVVLDAVSGQVPALRLSPQRSNRRAAIDTLRRRGPRRSETTTARVAIVARPMDELVVHVAAGLGARPEDRLFRVCDLVTLLRDPTRQPDWSRVYELAKAGGTLKATADGLAMVRGVLDPDPVPFAFAAVANNHPPHVLEWARYGSGELDRHAALRRPFLFALALLRTPGVWERTALVARSLVVSDGRRVLTDVMRDAFRGLRRWRRDSVSDPRELAYWIEPDRLLQPSAPGEQR